ncbi:hypothetical protein BU17DRAFT_81363 [Hysterangium stoloniferum]|nr:hypothetical protein BU17DRAFT_81363 [Hysterangium stoloniferum]
MITPLKVEEEDDVSSQDDFRPFMQRRPRRLTVATLLSILIVVGIVTAAAIFWWTRSPRDGIMSLPNLFHPGPPPPPPPHPHQSPAPPNTKLLSAEQQWKEKVSKLVVGEPTAGFQENLRPDLQYITTWVSGGWTNDFMAYINLIYLAMISSRIPIIPPFAPSHVSMDGGFPYFSDIFDLPLLSESIGQVILEWKDVKNSSSEQRDMLGCWSIWGLVGSESENPQKDGRPSMIPWKLHLDVAYTSLPPSTEVFGQLWVKFWSLAKLGFPSHRQPALAEAVVRRPAPESQQYIPPDERLLCWDFLYFVAAQDTDEWWHEWSPAWRFVGKYARWNKKLEEIARGYIQRTLGVEESDTLPPYIAVHIRHGDFGASCGDNPDECFRPLSDYEGHVTEIMASLKLKGITLPSHHVLVTSDERRPAWWAQVAALGWRYTDHVREKTEDRYGKWYPSLIDAVAQSMGVGFVGTDHSTMSMVAMRRVKDWNGGEGVMTRLW